jgi:hypothetical protein
VLFQAQRDLLSQWRSFQQEALPATLDEALVRIGNGRFNDPAVTHSFVDHGFLALKALGTRVTDPLGAGGLKSC